MNINNINFCSDAVYELIQRTDLHFSLKYVCKAFADNYFKAFFKNCLNNASLVDRGLFIQRSYPALSSQEQVQKLYKSILENVKDVKEDGEKNIGLITASMSMDQIERLCSWTMDNSFIESDLTSKNLSIDKLHRLESWLEDKSVVQLFEKVGNQIDFARTFSIDIRRKSLSEKVHDIREWFFSYESDLVRIEKFILDRHNFVKLPKEIGLFPQLKKLTLRENQLISLPPEIGKLTRLQHLDLMDNRLTSLPATVGQLTHLQTLCLEGNPLAPLPVEMDLLTELEVLYLSPQQLKGLPLKLKALLNSDKINLCMLHGLSYAKQGLIKFSGPKWDEFN